MSSYTSHHLLARCNSLAVSGLVGADPKCFARGSSLALGRDGWARACTRTSRVGGRPPTNGRLVPPPRHRIGVQGLLDLYKMGNIVDGITLIKRLLLVSGARSANAVPENRDAHVRQPHQPAMLAQVAANKGSLLSWQILFRLYRLHPPTLEPQVYIKNAQKSSCKIRGSGLIIVQAREPCLSQDLDKLFLVVVRHRRDGVLEVGLDLVNYPPLLRM